ncbi:hypothetical protein CALCODRAFT_486212 [Calocera cornea HHB12733]|uniref:F-box domain-containing protein n=1 Tax=Calocera cornea HHB12733 TaxID=1353952 RepID=A0A165DV95_9BASI|nr:hypothetical protein CALCODRAFT_486212 [Calocera cornea HHB12733]
MSHSPPPLPLELLDSIVSLVDGEYDLTQLCLANKPLLHLARRELYRHVILEVDEKGVRTLRLCGSLTSAPHLARFVKRATVQAWEIVGDGLGPGLQRTPVFISAWARAIHRALGALPNLKQLTLGPLLPDCTPHLLRSGLQLEDLGAAAIWATGEGMHLDTRWPQFLATQTQLKRLALIRSEHPLHRLPQDWTKPLDPAAFPALECLLGSADLAYLVPGRKIHFYGSYDEELHRWSLADQRLLFDHLSLSTGPLRCLQLLVGTPLRLELLDLIAETLPDLVTLKVELDDLLGLTALPCHSTQPGTVEPPSFSSLVNLHFKMEFGPGQRDVHLPSCASDFSPLPGWLGARNPALRLVAFSTLGSPDENGDDDTIRDLFYLREVGKDGRDRNAWKAHEGLRNLSAGAFNGLDLKRYMMELAAAGSGLMSVGTRLVSY